MNIITRMLFHPTERQQIKDQKMTGLRQIADNCYNNAYNSDYIKQTALAIIKGEKEPYKVIAQHTGIKYFCCESQLTASQTKALAMLYVFQNGQINKQGLIAWLKNISPEHSLTDTIKSKDLPTVTNNNGDFTIDLTPSLKINFMMTVETVALIKPSTLPDNIKQAFTDRVNIVETPTTTTISVDKNKIFYCDKKVYEQCREDLKTITKLPDDKINQMLYQSIGNINNIIGCPQLERALETVFDISKQHKEQVIAILRKFNQPVLTNKQLQATLENDDLYKYYREQIDNQYNCRTNEQIIADYIRKHFSHQYPKKCT